LGGETILRDSRKAPDEFEVMLHVGVLWYWLIDEIEQAGCVARLVRARKAKLMMGLINKTDKLDAHGFNTLQRNGTLLKSCGNCGS
jgi:transposase